MKKIISCLVFLFLTLCLFSQVVEEEMPPKEEKIIYSIVEEKPVFDGGDKAMFKFLAGNMRYPAEARSHHIEGTVILRYLINSDGSLSDIQVIRGISGGCSEEAIRVVKSMPNWIPGKHNGEAVNIYYTLPIKFKLEGPSINGNDDTIVKDSIETLSKGKKDKIIYSYVPQPPEFLGGRDSLWKFIDTNLIYPVLAKEKGIHGNVVVRFIISDDGTISGAKVMKSLGSGCDEEALRIVSLMPKWKPGRKDEKDVNVNYTLPIKFKL
jgi:TonB family protein